VSGGLVRIEPEIAENGYIMIFFFFKYHCETIL